MSFGIDFGSILEAFLSLSSMLFRERFFIDFYMAFLPDLEPKSHQNHNTRASVSTHFFLPFSIRPRKGVFVKVPWLTLAPFGSIWFVSGTFLATFWHQKSSLAAPESADIYVINHIYIEHPQTIADNLPEGIAGTLQHAWNILLDHTGTYRE
jgi:hypothetical protein